MFNILLSHKRLLIFYHLLQFDRLPIYNTKIAIEAYLDEVNVI